jgi:hypothetical protein
VSGLAGIIVWIALIAVLVCCCKCKKKSSKEEFEYLKYQPQFQPPYYISTKEAMV